MTFPPHNQQRQSTEGMKHAMKLVERIIIEYRIQQQVEIDDIQFGFMKDKGIE